MKTTSGRDDHISSQAEHAFADYVQRVAHGEQIVFADFVAQHPELKTELDSLMRHWESMQRLLPGPVHETLADQLERRYGQHVNPAVTLEAEGKVSDSLLARLALRADPFGRYRVKEEIGHGGMGIVLRVWDDDLRRHLAMKMIKEPGEHDPERELATLYRFMEEAQVTGQLDHPGIVPVHEVGLAPNGLVYFTMKLVKGEDLEAIFKCVERGEAGWSQTRLLGVLQKVCEAISYAHDRGVIHRDLKPSNIMIGRYGEVYVMDWGLARIIGREDRHDVRIQPIEAVTSLQSERRDKIQSDPNSPLFTVDGKPLGTPIYMPPEQADGKLDQLGAWSDVYSVGAMLYQLLTRRRPYVRPTELVDGYEILGRVRAGPPERVTTLAPTAPAELVAICERAMARSPHDRYATMNELGDDLRAYLEGRVVRAHRVGPLIELRKWVGRNKYAAAAITFGILVLIIGSAAVALIQRAARLSTERDLFERSVALAVSRSDELWPVHPNLVPAMRQWLREAQELVSAQDRYRRELEALRQRGHASAVDAHLDPERKQVNERLRNQEELLRNMRANLAYARKASTEVARENASIIEYELPILEHEISDLKRDVAALEPWEFSNAHDREENLRLAPLARYLEKLSRTDSGLIAQVSRRLHDAETLEERSFGGEMDALWQEAVDDISDEVGSPQYHGLHLDKQLGLAPLRKNPATQLWEFWHVLSGQRPEPKNDTEWIITPDTGIVLILVPGQRYTLGASDRAGDRHYEPGASIPDIPQHDLPLSAFFLSRYEMTQAQWRRATGSLPCWSPPGRFHAQETRLTSATHPVESVSWIECDRVLWRWGLEIPTEAQWEAAARADTDEPFWWGAKIPTPPPLNFSDASAQRAGGPPCTINDGYVVHSPVDALVSNAFGFQSILGNVSEWCRDWFVAGSTRQFVPGSGECIAQLRQMKSLRGGGFGDPLSACSVTHRASADAKYVDWHVGIRPARIVSSDR